MILSDTRKKKKRKGFSDHIQIKRTINEVESATINEVKSAVGNTSIQAIKWNAPQLSKIY